MAEIDKYVYRRLEMNYPFLLENSKEYSQVSDREVLISMNDGSIVSYDDVEVSFRTLPKSCYDLSEEQYRREFSMRLRRAIEDRHITQTMLSEMTGISTVLLSRYLNGKTSPSFYNIDKIAKALECSTDKLRYINVFEK